MAKYFDSQYLVRIYDGCLFRLVFQTFCAIHFAVFMAAKIVSIVCKCILAVTNLMF